MISASAVDAAAFLSQAAYRQDGDSTTGEHDLSTTLSSSGWTIVHPSQLGLPTLDPDDEYFEVRVGSSSGPVAAALLAMKDGVLAIAFRGSDENGDLFAAVNNQSGYFNSYRPFLDAAMAYASNPANAVAQVLIAGHSLGGAMAEWFANVYVSDVAALEDAARFACCCCGGLTV
jgi:Prolyl oligopeptidase family